MKKFLKKHWPLVAMGFVLALVTVYLFQGQKEPTGKTVAQDKESQQGIRLKDIHYLQDDPGHKVKWVLDASEAKLSKDQQVVTFLDFQVTLEPANRPAVTLRGNQGEYDKGTGRLVLQGNLIGETEDGYRFATEKAVYHHKEGYLETDKAVKISGAFFSVEGKGLLLDLGKETVQVLSNVTTLIHGEHPIL
jgi:LPS export ABC transporter protein LptC